MQGYTVKLDVHGKSYAFTTVASFIRKHDANAYIVGVLKTVAQGGMKGKARVTFRKTDDSGRDLEWAEDARVDVLGES